MEISQTSWLLIGIIVGIGFLVSIRRYWQSTRPKARCRHCGANKMTEVGRETLGSRTIEVGNGGSSFGGDIRVQLQQEVTYHCSVCHKETKETLHKTH